MLKIECVEVWGKENCERCKKAKQVLLAKHANIIDRIEEKDISELGKENESARRIIQARLADQDMVLPVVLIKERFIDVGELLFVCDGDACTV